MKRLLRSVFTPLGLAVLGLLVLAGWAAVSAGVFDGPIARQVPDAGRPAEPPLPTAVRSTGPAQPVLVVVRP